jgi:PilZ domain
METAKNLVGPLALVRSYPTSDYHREGDNTVHERRLGFRIPFETMVTSYVRDRPVRGLATNLSDSGLNLSAISLLAPPPGMVVGLELDLPGVGDSIWASGQICYRKDDRMASGLGVRFLAMAKSQARLVRDFCIEMRRKNLGALLARIRE